MPKRRDFYVVNTDIRQTHAVERDRIALGWSTKTEAGAGLTDAAMRTVTSTKKRQRNIKAIGR